MTITTTVIQVPLQITVKNYLGFVRQQSTGLSADPSLSVASCAAGSTVHRPAQPV